MYFLNILLPILLCNAGSSMPISSLDANIQAKSRPLQIIHNPSLTTAFDAHSLRARRSDIPTDSSMKLSLPTAKVRPSFPPSSDDLPTLIEMMAQTNNLSLPLSDVIALEHYKYRENLPPGYATAYDAQRERNRTISDEVDRCLTIWNDCEDVDSHHHRMDRSDECINVRIAGETVFDQEMILVEQGRKVFQSLNVKGLQKREEGENEVKIGDPWPFHCHFPTGKCHGYPPSCHYWMFEHNCWYREVYQVPEWKLKRIDGIKDHDEKLRAEADLGNKINEIDSKISHYKSRRHAMHRGLPHDERSGPLEVFRNVPDINETRPTISKVIAKRRKRKPLSWDVVGVGMPDTSMLDKWGNDIWSTCTDTWMEPGAVGEINAQLVASHIK